MPNYSRGKNTRSVPDKKAGRHRPPKVEPNPPKHPHGTSKLHVAANGKKRMIKEQS